MASNNHDFVGQDFTPTDVPAKVKGTINYADDFNPDRLLHAKTVKSPYAHAEVKSIDTSAAEAMSGVRAVVTYEDNRGTAGTSEGGSAPGEPPMDKEPSVFGYPVAAVAAEDEYTAASAVDAIDVEYDVKEHVVDPRESLKPDGPNAKQAGNSLTQGEEGMVVDEVKWDGADFSSTFPENPGDWNIQWSWGDVEGGFAEADEVIEEVKVAHPIATNPMEPRSNVAHWKADDTVTVWGSSQSIGVTHYGLAGALQVNPQDLQFICPAAGGGFGSKGATYPAMAVPALLSREVNRPVKMRGTRREEFHWGNGRASAYYKFRIGATDDGRVTALDIQGIGDGGAYSTGGLNMLGAGFDAISSELQPETMRVRGISVLTNTPKRWPMRGPGENQMAMAIVPVLDDLAERLGMDRMEFRKVNAPNADNPGVVGADKTEMSSAYLEEAYDKTAELFDWEEKLDQYSGERDGSTVYGVGLGFGDHSSGYVGLDGMIRITTDGTVEVRTGVGNLGTYSTHASPRVVAETLDVPWDQVRPMFGDSTEGAFTQGQYGSNTTFTTSLAENVAAKNAITYLKEIAAEELGGSPDDYEVAEGEVRSTSGSDALTLAEAAQAAQAMGGKYSAESIPQEGDLNPMTLWNVEEIRGTGLVALGHSTPEMAPGQVRSFATAATLVGVDVETGDVNVEECVSIADCGTVLHPESAMAQIEGGTLQGIGYATTEHYNYDTDTGIPVNTDWYKNKPPSIHENPDDFVVDAVGEPDPYGPYGIKGIGEPPYGAGASAITSAIRDALGMTFDEPPIRPADVIDAIESGEAEVN